MKYFSTFSGIGGFELGIQQAYERNNLRGGDRETKNSQSISSEQSVETTEPNTQRQGHPPSTEFIGDTGSLSCIGFSEIDKYAIQTYQKHFPEHKNYGDIKLINENELPDFDLLVGGFPCQSFSIAGKRKGFEDTRGTMFFELARILRAKQPRLFVFENVKGLLSHDNGQTFTTIIATLDELGYDTEWQVLNSKNHGVPQNRERVFIIGHLRGTPRPEVFPFGANDRETPDVQGHVANTLTARYKGAEAIGTYVEESEQYAQIQQLNQPKHSNDRVYGTDGVSPTLNTMQGGMRQPKVLAIKYGQNNPERNGNTDENMFTLKTGGANAGVTDGMKIRRLTPTECERLQGFPDGWTEGVSDTQRYKQCGNAVTVNVIKDLFERIIK